MLKSYSSLFVNKFNAVTYSVSINPWESVAAVVIASKNEAVRFVAVIPPAKAPPIEPEPIDGNEPEYAVDLNTPSLSNESACKVAIEETRTYWEPPVNDPVNCT